MAAWELVDLTAGVRHAVASLDELRAGLSASAVSRLVMLRHESGVMLGLALGPETSAAYWGEAAAVLTDRVLNVSEEPGPEAWHIEPSALVPTDVILKLAAFVFQYRELPTWAEAGLACRVFLNPWNIAMDSTIVEAIWERRAPSPYGAV